MSSLFVVLPPILIADVLNPVLLAGVIYCLGSRHPYVNVWTMLFSFFISYFAAGIILAIGLERFTHLLHIPVSFDYVLEFLVAILLFFFAWKMYKNGESHPEDALVEDKAMSIWDASAMGLNINLIGLPFAIPYLAAIDQILKVDLNTIQAVSTLLLYNILYVLPFISLVIIKWSYHRKSHAIFKSINLWMHRMLVSYIPLIFVILGLLLIEDCVSFFLGYREYSFLSLT